MLSLASSNIPRLTGTRLSVNCVIVCSTPSSKTWKSPCVRPVMSRPLASVTDTVTWTMSTRLRNGPVWPHAMAQPRTQQAVIAPTRWYVTALPVNSRSRFDTRVIVLQRSDRERLLPHGANRAHRRRGAGQRRDARDLRHRRGAPDRAIVEERLAAERRVDHHVDAAVDDVVGHVRPSLVHLVHDIDVQTMRAEKRGGATRCGQGEPELREISRNRQHRLLVAVVHADEHAALLGQALSRAHHRFAEGRAEVVGTAHDFAGGLHLRAEDRIDAR